MIVPDINLLLYAHLEGFKQHAAAARWWEQTLGGNQPVGIAPAALFGFIRVCTNPRIFTGPLSVEEAIAVVEEWLARDNVRVLLPGPRHLEVAFRLLRELGSAGNLTTDVQLAALAIEHQAELHSNDTDFARFSGLKWVNPLRVR